MVLKSRIEKNETIICEETKSSLNCYSHSRLTKVEMLRNKIVASKLNSCKRDKYIKEFYMLILQLSFLSLK